MAGADPLLDLLAACVVRIDRDGEFSGTGFLVTAGEVLTCAHVVHGGRPLAVTLADGAICTAQPASPLLAPFDPAARFYPHPDAALLRLDAPPDDHPCVRLDTALPAVGDLIHLVGYTQGEHAADVVSRSGAALCVETLPVEDGHTLVKFREGQVVGGFSGGPLLNRRTGAVVAVIESTRSGSSALGGFGVPISDVASFVGPALFDRNTAATADGRWARAVQEQAAAEAERAGRRELLPLLDAIVPLELGADVAPSDLLHPRHAVVPFVPRGDLLEQVMLWRESEARLSVLVLAGGGGFGKTRTALQMCRAATGAGWTAGPIDADEAGVDGLTDLATWPGRLLVTVDYAETRPDLVTALLRRLRRRSTPAACRVVLVVRQRADRQALIDLFATGDASADIAGLLRRAEWVGLGTGERELDRRALFATAATAFTTHGVGDCPRPAVPNLYAEHFARPLFVLAAALLAAQDPDLDVAGLSEDELLGQVLDRHEARYWQRADDRLQLGLHPDDQRVAVALMVAGGLRSDSADTALVRMVPTLGDALDERVALVVRWLRALYGSSGVLEPDLLGEVLLARVLAASPALAGTVLDEADPHQLVRALLVLSRVAGRSTAAREAVRDALDPRLPDLAAVAHQAPPEFVAALTLAGIATRPVIGAAQAQFRIQPLTALSGQLAVVLGQVAVDGLSSIEDADVATEIRPMVAGSLTFLSNHLSDVGRPAEGLAPIEEAVRHYRALADADPTRFLPDLAMSLNNLAARLTALGRTADARRVFDELLDQWNAPEWPRAVLLLGRARLLANADAGTAVHDALAAAAVMGDAGDRVRRGDARHLARRIAGTAPVLAAEAWSSISTEPMPAWLRLPDDDPVTAQLVIEWVRTATWDGSFAFLTEHSDVLLSDRGEATVEHLVDANPFNTVLDQHLALLQAARAGGIDAVRADVANEQATERLATTLQDWIDTPTWPESATHLAAHAADLLTDAAQHFLTASVGDQPHLLTYLGLLALACDLDVATAHTYVTDRDTLDDALRTASRTRLLHLARLHAGLHPDSGPAHLTHALAALTNGGSSEAEWAAGRCRDNSASWERAPLVAQAKAFAAEHPEVDVTALLGVLNSPSPD